MLLKFHSVPILKAVSKSSSKFSEYIHYFESGVVRPYLRVGVKMKLVKFSLSSRYFSIDRVF